jgi:hypothetical protein
MLCELLNFTIGKSGMENWWTRMYVSSCRRHFASVTNVERSKGSSWKAGTPRYTRTCFSDPDLVLIVRLFDSLPSHAQCRVLISRRRQLIGLEACYDDQQIMQQIVDLATLSSSYQHKGAGSPLSH